MIHLKKLNLEDIKEEWDFIKNTPSDENGFTNRYYGCTFEDFEKNIIPKLIDESNGINLKEGRVSQVNIFIWDDDEIVGLFKFRPKLNDALRNGAGHLGYGIRKKYRNKGYASKTLGLFLEKYANLIDDKELYMSANKNNPYSIKVQLKNGAYIHHEDEDHIYTRIKIKK